LTGSRRCLTPQRGANKIITENPPSHRAITRSGSKNASLGGRAPRSGLPLPVFTSTSPAGMTDKGQAQGPFLQGSAVDSWVSWARGGGCLKTKMPTPLLPTSAVISMSRGLFSPTPAHEMGVLRLFVPTRSGAGEVVRQPQGPAPTGESGMSLSTPTAPWDFPSARAGLRAIRKKRCRRNSCRGNWGCPPDSLSFPPRLGDQGG